MTELTHAQAYVKESMLRYPTLYPTKEKALEHAFTCRSMDWDKQGRLVETYTQKTVEQEIVENAAELDADIAKVEAELVKEGDYMHDFNKMQLLCLQAEKIQREFLYANIDLIVRVGCHFKPMYGGSCTSMVLNSQTSPDARLSYDFMNIFVRPEKVEKSWAIAALDYIDSWQLALNYKYHVGNVKGNAQGDAYEDAAIAHWPDVAKELMNRLRKAKAELWPDANDGNTYADHLAFTKKMMDEFLAERKGKDDA